MTFSYTINKQSPDSCGLGIYTGTYTNTGSTTGGTISTPLRKINFCEANCMTSQAEDMNKTVRTDGAFDLTTVAGEDGQWVAIGF